MDKPLCALTTGDPSGIGPEVVLRTLVSVRACKAARMVVVGFREPLLRDAGVLNLDVSIREINSPREMTHERNTINCMVPNRIHTIPLTYGIVDKQCGKAAGRCIELSAELAMSGEVDAVVTAPINKESLNLAGYHYPGHTEFYQSLTGAADIAMMVSTGDFRVVHVTAHTAMKDVPGLIRKERIIRVASLMHEALHLLGISRPRIAVAGFNPHAGESGMFGHEELQHIIPGIEELKRSGMDVTGPLSPDTVFVRAYSGEFDGVVAMYHDQGHIALKLAGFRLGEGAREVAGVNTTLGLPIIRTSVDHGTAFDIAGKGIASPLSMIEAVEMAAAFARRRKTKE